MPSFRFLHVADLHLDSPLRGLEEDPEAPAGRIREASRRALANLVEFTLAEAVPLVVVAGDLFDGDWQDWRTGHYLTKQLARLTRAGVQVVMIRGNHDAESVLTRAMSLPEGATLLGAQSPETVDLPGIGAAVHGQSFAHRETLANLALGYPPPRSDRVNIGLLHTAASGGRDGHANYAPCSIEQLANHGYQYWALGHVHAREVLYEEPWIVFPGNLQGRHAKETGAKGATLVTVERGRVVGVEHVTFDTVRWEHLVLDVTGARDLAGSIALLNSPLAEALASAEDRLLALRVTLAGATQVHAALARDPGAIRDLVRNEVQASVGADAAWVEDVRVRTRPALDREALRARDDAVGTLVHAIEAAGTAEAAAAVKEYARKLLDRAPHLRDALGLDHPAVLAAAGEVSPELLARARDLLLARLAEG